MLVSKETWILFITLFHRIFSEKKFSHCEWKREFRWPLGSWKHLLVDFNKRPCLFVSPFIVPFSQIAQNGFWMPVWHKGWIWSLWPMTATDYGKMYFNFWSEESNSTNHSPGFGLISEFFTGSWPIRSQSFTNLKFSPKKTHNKGLLMEPKFIDGVIQTFFPLAFLMTSCVIATSWLSPRQLRKSFWVSSFHKMYSLDTDDADDAHCGWQNLIAINSRPLDTWYQSRWWAEASLKFN